MCKHGENRSWKYSSWYHWRRCRWKQQQAMRQNCKKSLLGKTPWLVTEIMEPTLQNLFDTFWNGFPEEIITRLKNSQDVRSFVKLTSLILVQQSSMTLDHAKWKLVSWLFIHQPRPVLQIAAHEHHSALDRFCRICEYAHVPSLERPALLGRIITRPYVGEPGNFTSANRQETWLFTICASCFGQVEQLVSIPMQLVRSTICLQRCWYQPDEPQ